jgi:hypothetical protein
MVHDWMRMELEYLTLDFAGSSTVCDIQFCRNYHLPPHALHSKMLCIVHYMPETAMFGYLYEQIRDKTYKLNRPELLNQPQI